MTQKQSTPYSRLFAFVMGIGLALLWYAQKHQVIYAGLSSDDAIAAIILGVTGTSAFSLCMPILCVFEAYSSQRWNFFLLFLMILGFIVCMSSIVIYRGFLMPAIVYGMSSILIALFFYRLTCTLERLITKQHRP
jgi:hypothetical protein